VASTSVAHIFEQMFLLLDWINELNSPKIDSDTCGTFATGANDWGGCKEL